MTMAENLAECAELFRESLKTYMHNPNKEGECVVISAGFAFSKALLQAYDDPNLELAISLLTQAGMMCLRESQASVKPPVAQA